MYEVDIGGRNLALSAEAISFGHSVLQIEEIEGLTVIRTDVRVNGAWVSGTRFIAIRGTNKTLQIDCSQAFPDRDKLDRIFGDAFELIWSGVGARLMERMLIKLNNGGTVTIGGVRINRDGVWVEGSWRFLWWKAKPKLIPWADLKIFSNEGTLVLESVSDLRFRSEMNYNHTENAMVLDGAIRSLLHENNWKKLR
jgi:hypothetical protein